MSIELLKSISTQKAHKTCNKQGSILHYFGTNHLPLVKFAHNDNYQVSIQMAPYETLYGRPCKSPICLSEVGESSITSPDLIRDTSKKVSLIRQHLLTAQSR